MFAALLTCADLLRFAVILRFLRRVVPRFVLRLLLRFALRFLLLLRSFGLLFF